MDQVSKKHRPASEWRQACESGDQSASAGPASPLYPSPLVRSECIGGRGNSQVHAASMQAMKQTHGNRAVQRSMLAHSDP